MKFYVYPYKKGSKSAKLLADKLDGKVIKREGSNFKENLLKKCVINWGSSGIPYGALNRNAPVAGNKLQSFNLLKQAGVSIPPFTTSKEEASVWSATKTVLARTVLTGHSGNGIVIIPTDTVSVAMPNAPLYVQYIPKKAEYRVHVVRGKVIHVQQKKKKEGFESNKIRSHANGYVFAINDIDPPESVLSEAVKAVEALGLDFGAVDVIYNEKQQKAFVLEVNTAPGLCETTANKYAEAFKSL
jgi:glutathione synthase/RimK-type ligase-like ATP-grasp enzyme